jgi:hypothetical protein
VDQSLSPQPQLAKGVRRSVDTCPLRQTCRQQHAKDDRESKIKTMSQQKKKKNKGNYYQICKQKACTVKQKYW